MTGRVLMLVDTLVEDDGRVQKAARAMAEAGYEVTLLGRSPTDSWDSWRIGDAVVRRVPVDLARDRAQRRRLYRARKAVRLLTGRRPGPASSSGGTAAALPARRAADDNVFDAARAWFWRLVRGRGCWPVLVPYLLDFEHAYRPVVDALRPDLIHAHDYKMLGIAVRAARRLRARGLDVRVVYDAHEFLPGVGGPTVRWRLGHEAYERAHVRAADAVVAVSPEMARRIGRRYRLPTAPEVVLNAPPAPAAACRPAGSGDVRTALGLPAEVPLLVYVGVSAAKRGLAAVVEALALVPGAHLALVTRRNDYVAELERAAATAGVADRLHVLGYVPVEDVVPFIATATAGVQSMLRIGNYDVTIATKYFDYVQARLPVVQSDVQVMAAVTRDLGNGEVFAAGDRDSFAAAVRAVLADPDRYRAAYERRPDLLAAWTWERQAEVLESVYRRVLAAPAGRPVPAPAHG